MRPSPHAHVLLIARRAPLIPFHTTIGNSHYLTALADLAHLVFNAHVRPPLFNHHETIDQFIVSTVHIPQRQRHRRNAVRLCPRAALNVQFRFQFIVVDRARGTPDLVRSHLTLAQGPAVLFPVHVHHKPVS